MAGKKGEKEKSAGFENLSVNFNTFPVLTVKHEKKKVFSTLSVHAG